MDDSARWGWDDDPDQFDEPTPDDEISQPPVMPQMPPPPPAKNPRMLHFAYEALEPQPPIEWVVDSLFSEGSLSLVVGEPGCKKTWSMLDLSVCIAVGEIWLDFATKQAPVLIIDEESGDRRLKRRLGNALRGHNAQVDTPLYYTALGGFDLGKPVDAKQIQDLIFITGAKFVLIDALVDVMMGRDENAAQFVQPIFHALRTVADNTQAAIVVIHHSAKNGGYRGSSAIKGAVDQMLMVESKPDEDQITFFSDKARDTKHAGFSATANFETDKFYLMPTAAKPGGRKLSVSQEFVLKFLDICKSAGSGGQSVDDIVASADVCSPSAARKAVYSLAAPMMEYIRRTNTGGGGVKAFYALTQKGQEYVDGMP